MPPVRPPERVRGELLLLVREPVAARGRSHDEPHRARRAARARRGGRRGARPAARRHGDARRAAGAQRRQSVRARRRGHGARPPSRVRHLPRRHHRLPSGRGSPARRRRLRGRRRLLAQRDLHRPQARRDRGPAPSGRPADRALRARVPGRERRLVSTRETDHLSIGEVLAALNDEFPDITISKIRFLESQGLVNPERTPSGYRKFYPHDLARLRWILYQQKQHFLPLKVIKERLDELPPGEEGRLLDPAPATAAEATEPDATAAEGAVVGTLTAPPVATAPPPPRPPPRAARPAGPRRPSRPPCRPTRVAPRTTSCLRTTPTRSTHVPSSSPPPGSTMHSCPSSRATAWSRPRARSTASRSTTTTPST